MDKLEENLTCCVSGSLSKFKPEIDLVIDECMENGVEVLAPEKGWLYLPKHKLLTISGSGQNFRPLPGETDMTIKQIEDQFLLRVAESSFLYVANFEGYIGNSAAMEIGFALGRGVPVF